MADIALTDEWDLAFIDGDLAEVTGGHLTRQNSKFRLQIIAGELFEDTRAGVPWLSDMVDPRVSMDAKKAILRANIVQSFGCISVDSLSVVIDNDIARVNFSGTCAAGQFEDSLVIYRGGEQSNDLPQFGTQARIINLPAIDDDYTTTFTMYGTEPVLCIVDELTTGNSCEIVTLGNLVIYTSDGQLLTSGNGAVTLTPEQVYDDLYIYIYQPFPAPQKTVTLSFVIDDTDADALALFARMDTEPSDELKEKIDTLIKALKSADIWDDLDTLYVPVLGETEQARLLDWKANRSATLVGVNAETNATYGFEVGASSYVDTGFRVGEDCVNAESDNHCSFAFVTKVYLRDGTGPDYLQFGLAGNDYGVSATDADYSLIASSASDQLFPSAGAGTLQANELYAISRSSTSSWGIYKGSSAVATGTGYFTAFPNIGSTMRVLDIYSTITNTGGVGVFGMGAYMDSTKLAALKSAIQAYIA